MLFIRCITNVEKKTVDKETNFEVLSLLYET